MVVLSSDYFNENDLKSNALDNISIKIDLPSLDKRGLVERLEIVQECFKNEARKIDKSFVVEPETLECLLLYHCKNNIKQLINDISSACSHAFLKNLDNDSNVYVYLDDFPIYVKKGFIFYKEKDIALLILDVMMPKMDGWEVCREIRKNSKVPIIMLTARGDERDELLGFELGVDEYISKPFSPKILVARVEAILRRTGQSNPDEILSAGGIVIDKAAHQATVDDKPMDLSFKEFELLTYFLENEGIALSREKILNSVWNYDYFGDARTIDTHVKKLRSKMGDKGEYIKTVWGMGYKFEVGE